MRLLNIYKSILRFAGLDTNEEGYVYLKGKPTEPTIINEARLVLPTQEHLKNPSDDKILFHPLVEDIIRGETEIVKKLKLNINIRLNITISVLVQNLLQLVASPALHGALTPEQGELLTAISDADDKTVTNIGTYIVSNHKEKTDKMFINIFLKRGGSVGDKKFNRAAIVHFPFYEDLKDGKIEKIRVKDKEPYRQIMEFIFPDIMELDGYSYGSDGETAPFLEALMMGSGRIAGRLNELILLYKNNIDNYEDILFDLDWVDNFMNLSELAPDIRQIPKQRGNEGALDIFTNEPIKGQPIPIQPQQPIPYQQPMMGHQSQFIPQPPKPAIRETGKGLDFKSIVQSNPQLQMLPNALGSTLAQQRGMAMPPPQERMPTWAIPQPQQPIPYQQPQQMNVGFQQPMPYQQPYQPQMGFQQPMPQYGQQQQPYMPAQYNGAVI